LLSTGDLPIDRYSATLYLLGKVLLLDHIKHFGSRIRLKSEGQPQPAVNGESPAGFALCPTAAELEELPREAIVAACAACAD
jgi:hypothetical protein